jgi:hypothetical protein
MIHPQIERRAGYLASYLLPFLTVAEPSWRDLVAYGLFLAVTATVYMAQCSGPCHQGQSSVV